MAEKLSNEELKNLEENLNKAMAELEKEKGLMDRFYHQPIEFLKNFGIKIMNYIQKSADLAKRFVNGIRDIIDGVKRIVNKCLRCKTAVLCILIGTLGKSNLVWGAVVGAMDFIKDSVKQFFDKTGKEVDKAFSFIDNTIDKMRPSHLAILICQSLGYCP